MTKKLKIQPVHIRMAFTIMIAGATGLFTPLLLRTAIDGILTTGDINALFFAMLSVAWIELVGIFCDFLFKKDINELTRDYIVETKQRLLKKMADGKAAMTEDELLRLFMRDLRTVASTRLRDRWIVSKDALTLLLLGTVTFLVSPQAGLFLVGLLIAHISFGIWSSKSSRSKTKSWIELQEMEESIVANWSAKVVVARDAGDITGLTERTFARIRSVGDEIATSNSFKERVDSIFRVFRTFSIFGLLTFVLMSTDQLGEATGTIWALTMILFRVSRPIESVSKWALQEARSESAVRRVSKWLDHDICSRGEPPVHYSSAKRVLEKCYENPGVRWNFTGSAEEIATFVECVRIWRERTVSKCRVLIFHSTFDMRTLEDTSKPVILILDQFSMLKHPDQIEFREGLAVSLPSHVSTLICDPLPWTPDAELSVIVQDGAFTIVDSKSAVRALKALECGKLLRKDIAELENDLRRFHRLNVPLSVVYLRLTHTEVPLFKETIRSFDHLIPIEEDFYLVSLANCTEENIPLALRRVEQKVNRVLPICHGEVACLTANSDPSKRGYDELILFVATRLARRNGVVSYREAA